MLRNVTMDEISDGKRYTANDMARVDSQGCSGCHACCCHMDNSILLDPYDIRQLTSGTGQSFELLLTGPLKLTLADGIILPAIAMTKEKDCCSFLDRQGRCSIHAFRPGLCRLYPLGRYYEDNSFTYFLQTNQCCSPRLSKVKIKNWLEIPLLKNYEGFVRDWHYFLRDAAIQLDGLDERLTAVFHKYLLKTFYLTPYSNNDSSDSDLLFYSEFSRRLEAARKMLLE